MDKSNKKLFVFDDDATLIALIKRIAEKKYSNIFTAVSCKKALSMVNDDVKNFDMVMTDLKFPDGNGIDILRAVKKKAPYATVVLFTGFASLETAVQAIDEGAFDYITKPFTLEQVLALLCKMENYIDLQKENLLLRKKMQKSTIMLDRQVTKYEDLLDEIQKIRQTQLQQGEMIKKILSFLGSKNHVPH